MSIQILNQQKRRISIRGLRAAALCALESENRSSWDVSLLLTDDETVHALNRDYRGKDKPTDVLSFALLDSVEGAPEFTNSRELGDVIIAVPYAARQAKAYGRTVQQELELLTVHGVLHLLGYEDDTDEGADTMRKREIALGVRPFDETLVRQSPIIS